MASLGWTQRLAAAGNRKKNNFLQAITVQETDTTNRKKERTSYILLFNQT